MTQEPELILAQQRVIAEQQAELAHARATQCVYCCDLPTFRDNAIFLGEQQLTRDGMLANYQTRVVRQYHYAQKEAPYITYLFMDGDWTNCRIHETRREWRASALSMSTDVLHPSFSYALRGQSFIGRFTMALCPHSLPVWLALFQEIHDHYNPTSAQ